MERVSNLAPRPRFKVTLMPKYCLKQLPSNSTPGLGIGRIRFYALLHSQNRECFLMSQELEEPHRKAMAWTWICQKYLQVRGPWDSPDTRVFKQLSQCHTQPPLSSRLLWRAGNQQWSLLTSLSVFPNFNSQDLGSFLTFFQELFFWGGVDFSSSLRKFW